MLERLWQRARPFRTWIVLAIPVELLGLLVLAGAFLEGDEGTNWKLVLFGSVLVATPLPWVAARICSMHLWRDIRRFPVAMAFAVLAWLVGGFTVAMADDGVEGDSGALIFGLCVAGAPLLWIAARVALVRWRRRLLVRELKTVLPDGPPLGPNTFCDLPFVIAGRRIYYPLGKTLESQDVDRLVWAYGEIFNFWIMSQIALWNRDSHAVILPIYRPDMPEALKRLSAAAPWIATGFNRALVDSWNHDHADFLDLVDQGRASGRAFAPAWAAGAGPVTCHSGVDLSIFDGGAKNREEQREIAKAMARRSKTEPV